jgi:AraC-like DNA-binding protein
VSLFAVVTVHTCAGSVGQSRNLFSTPSELRLAPAADAMARVSRCDLGALVIGEVFSTGHDVDVNEPLSASLVVPLHGRLTSETNGTSLRASAGEALLFSANRRRTQVERTAGDWFVGVPLIFPTRRLRAAAERIGFRPATLRSLDRFSMRLSATAEPAVQEMLQLVAVLYSEIRRDAPVLRRESGRASWAQLLNEKLIEILQLQGVICAPNPAARSASLYHVKRAQDYMNAHYGDIISMVEIANCCGIGIRALQEAFRSRLDLSPQQYLAAIRLDHARQRLLSDDTPLTVSQVALECGFSHLGRFAVAYRKRFGETPSATLRGRLETRIGVDGRGQM